MNLQILNDKYAICKFNVNSDLPDWVKDSDFYSVTKTNDELSVVCKQSGSLDNCEISEDWQILKVAGPLGLSLIGIIAEISVTLKKSKIPKNILETKTFGELICSNAIKEKIIKILRNKYIKTIF